MQPKLAHEYRKNDPFPKNAPWETLIDDQTLYVESTGITRDGRIHIITGDGRDMTFDPMEEPKFPRRPHGETRDWVTEAKTPVPMGMAIGDVVFGDYVIVSMQAHSPRTPQNLRITVRHMENGLLHTDVCGYLQPFSVGMNAYVKAKKVSDEDRILKPERGPYEDIEYDGVMYYFLVHSTGNGRWSDDIPVFRRKREPGTYKSRPPKRIGEWRSAKFRSADQSMRHPNDPLSRRNPG